MNPKAYKYFSYDVIDLVFSKEGLCGVKCSFPKDYNDPYELFLGVDLDVPTECLATYRDIVQELPQKPTTCFSQSPIVSPMWAHYAQDHSGFVLEFDIKKLSDAFEEVVIRDVEYKDEPDPVLADLLGKATFAMKPRHAVWLQQAVLKQAYFSKYSAWSYEQECRLVDVEGCTEDVAGNLILYVPSHCITSIVVGNKFPSGKVERSKEIAEAHGLNWYQLGIGKSYPLPYLITGEELTYVFDGVQIIEAENLCSACSEPTLQSNDLCPWCSITEAHAVQAAKGNPFRILDHYGQLDEYMEFVKKIERRGR